MDRITDLKNKTTKSLESIGRKAGVRRRDIGDVAFYFIFVVFTFFLWNDLSFFGELAAEKAAVIARNYTYVTKYTVKLRMLDHFGHYVYLPFCTWVDGYFKISHISWMSPNLVTAVHFCMAVCSGRLLASTVLLVRRVGVLTFECRSMLDIMDGVIYRAQSRTKAVLSGWGTWGYMVDGVADTTGSLFLMAGILWRYNKKPPLKASASRKLHEKYKASAASDSESGHKLLCASDSSFDEVDGEADRYSRTYVNCTTIFLAASVGLRGALWDHFLHNYHTLLAVQRPDADVRTQLEILHSGTTWFCLWLWKFHSADAFLSYTLVAIFFDKLWCWMRFWLFATVPNLVVVGLICNFHVMHVRTLLGISNSY